MSPVISSREPNGSMYPGERASFEEVRQLREAVVALADQVLTLQANYMHPEGVPTVESTAQLLAAEPVAIKRARRGIAPAESIQEFAERLRKQATAVGPGGPPADVNAALRDARAASYARRWPGGTDDPDARPKGWRRRGRR